MGDQDKPPSNADDWRSRRPQTWQGWVYRLGLVAFVMAMIVLTVFYHQLWGFYVAIAVIAADHFAFRRKSRTLQVEVSAADPDAPSAAQKRLNKKLFIIEMILGVSGFLAMQVALFARQFGLIITNEQLKTILSFSLVVMVLSPMVLLPALFVGRRRLQSKSRQGVAIMAMMILSALGFLLKAYFEFIKDWRFGIQYAAMGILILSLVMTVSWPLGDKKPDSAPTP